jgi:solute:Na+ symporter, SSS family
MPIYLVIQQWWSVLAAFAVMALTSVILKKNWLDKLEE